MGTPFESPTTPPRTHVANLSQNDTATGTFHQQAPSVYSSGYSVEVSRDGLMQGISPFVPQVPFEFFKRNILPPLPDTVNVAHVVADLKARKIIDDDRWKAFPCDPCYVKRPESDEGKTFSALKTIITEIIVSSGLGTATTVDYQNNPDHIPLCDYVQKAGKPDGYMVFRHDGKPRPAEERVRWREICCIGEFKLQDSEEDIKDNVAKTCWNMYRVMYEDPRRRFIHAFTIENTTMRLWMGSRSEIVVSDMFNFMKDHKKVVHFFLSQLYAQEHELGLDPTMRLILPIKGPKPMYDIDVRVSGNTTLTFRTTELISDRNAAALCGRGTRVWSVVKVDDGVEDPKQTGVLKDCWVDADRTREGDILEQIRNSGNLPEYAQEALNSSLLTVLAHGDVFVHDIRDSTCDVMLRGADPRIYSEFNLRTPSCPIKANEHNSMNAASQISSQSADTVLTSSMATSAQDGDTRERNSNVRYRIVYKERCTPLDEITLLYDAFKCVAQLIGPLQLLHVAGWVHRDISSGNILIDKDGKLRLADFEYAKRLDDNKASNDSRTGTSFYMSTEVDYEQYLYTSSKKPKKSTQPVPEFVIFRKRPDVVATANTRSPDLNRSSDIPHKNRPVFHHNPLHDMESGWWIFLEFLINKERRFATSKDVTTSGTSGPPPPPAKDIGLTDDDRNYARRLFYGFAQRMMIMMNNGPELRRVLGRLPPSIAPIGEELLDLKVALVTRYREIEVTLPPVAKDACTTDLYWQFAQALRKITRTLKNLDDIRLSPLGVVHSREPLCCTGSIECEAHRNDSHGGMDPSNSVAGLSDAGVSTNSDSGLKRRRSSDRTATESSKKQKTGN